MYSNQQSAGGLSPNEIMTLTQELNRSFEKMKTNQQEQQVLMNNRQKCLAQLNENKLVKQELDLLKEGEDDSNVYKLVGPALIQEDLSEAKNTVGKRINYLEKEIKRIEDNFKNLELENAKMKNRAAEIQERFYKDPKMMEQMRAQLMQQK